MTVSHTYDTDQSLAGPTVLMAALLALVGLAGLVLARDDLVGLWLLGYLLGLPAVELAAVGVRGALARTG